MLCQVNREQVQLKERTQCDLIRVQLNNVGSFSWQQNTADKNDSLRAGCVSTLEPSPLLQICAVYFWLQLVSLFCTYRLMRHFIISTLKLKQTTFKMSHVIVSPWGIIVHSCVYWINGKNANVPSNRNNNSKKPSSGNWTIHGACECSITVAATVAKKASSCSNIATARSEKQE